MFAVTIYSTHAWPVSRDTEAPVKTQQTPGRNNTTQPYNNSYQPPWAKTDYQQHRISAVFAGAHNCIKVDRFRALLLTANFPTEFSDSKGNTPLHTAASVGCLRLIRECALWGIPLNKQNLLGETALNLATAQAKDIKSARSLLQLSADPNLIDYKGRTPLHFAVDLRDARLIDYFIAAGAKLDAQDESGETPLRRAAATRNYVAVESLLAFRANSNLADHQGITPLKAALNEQDPKMVNGLIRAGAKLQAPETDLEQTISTAMALEL